MYRRIGFAALGLAAASLAFALVPDSRYRVVNLVSDIPGMAPITDPNLVNPWGIALPPTGVFWISNTGTGTSTLYGGDVNGSPFFKNPLTVTIPGGAPTGQVFNPTNDFAVTSGSASGPARFIFASLTGRITGWNPLVPAPGSNQAQNGIIVPGAVYTGLALANNGSGNFLYAADVANNRIDVFNGQFQPASLSGSFSDPNLPAGYSTFNVQALGGKLYVTYTGENAEGELSGIVNEFDFNGNLIRRFATEGPLNEPWGLAIAPANFGSFGGSLLIGNFGNGRIHAYDRTTGKLLGSLKGKRGGPIRIDGLWGLQFGNGATAGDTNALYFAAGIENETHGLFGKIVLDD